MTEDNFKWTDELVREVIGIAHKDGYESIQETNLDKLLDIFKQSKLQSQDKPQPSSIDRIEVKDNKVIISHLSAHDNFKGHDTAHWYQFCSNKPLYSYPNSKIISAIEQAINGKEENNEELVGLLRDAVSSTWGNTSLEQTQILFDKFLHDRKLAKPTQGLL